MSNKTTVKIKINEKDMSNIKILKNLVPDELVKTDVAVAVAGSIDAGKCFGLGTKIMMYTGVLKNVEYIKIGDILMGDDSTPRKVLETHKGNGQLYKIIPENGESYIVNGKHILALKYSNINNIQYQEKIKKYCVCYTTFENNIPVRKTKFFDVLGREQKDKVYTKAVNFLKNKYYKFSTNNIIEISVEKYINLEKSQQNILKWFRVGVEFSDKMVPIDPYVIGYWLGNEISGSNNSRTNQKIINYNMEYFRQEKMLEKYNKYIPDIYKYNSRENRLKLLAGLIDSNGYYDKEIDMYYFIVLKEYEKLFDDIKYLIQSLGFLVLDYDKEIMHANVKNSHTMINTHIFEFSGNGQGEIPCLLENKKTTSKYSKNNTETKIRIEKVEIGEYYGFETDGNHRFLLGDFSVAHNSSLIGVLFSNELDDGNGSARSVVARHRHELDSGRTSDVSTKMLYCGNGKAITLIDLCGHEKYLKTTTHGITGQFPDYAVVIVAANRGILKMTKEHLGILFYMQIPVIIAITRVDIAPTEIYNNTVRSIKTMCKFYNKTPEFINSLSELSLNKEELNNKELDCIPRVKNLTKILHNTCDHIPVITISNKTGYYVNVLKQILYNLHPRKLWDASYMDGSVFYIDSVFNPPGIGLVLSGIVKGKTISVGDTVLFGPLGKEFIQIRIRSMHNNCKQNITELQDHERGCIAISVIGKQELSREMIHNGMIIVSDNKLVNNVCFRFKAEVEVLHHSATIGTGYSPVIHLGPIKQSARITNIEQIIYKKTLSESNKYDSNNNDNPVDKLTIRTGDKAIVLFKFKFTPEFIEHGVTFFFSEGTTRGVGKITGIVPMTEDLDAVSDPTKHKKSKKYKRSSKRNKEKSNVV